VEESGCLVEDAGGGVLGDRVVRYLEKPSCETRGTDLAGNGFS
jgi:hypothetical protein